MQGKKSNFNAFCFIFRSHCACDDLLYNCLKILAQNQNQHDRTFESLDTASIAKSIGNVFFNVLSLECAEPKYRKICYNSTRNLPRRGKLFFNFLSFSSSIDNVKENEENIQCHHWTLDKSFPPNFVFRKPNRVFWINRFMRKEIVMLYCTARALDEYCPFHWIS